MWVRITLQLLHHVLTIRASTITINNHCQNVLMTYSHVNLNVHNLDCIQAFHQEKHCSPSLCTSVPHHAQLSYELVQNRRFSKALNTYRWSCKTYTRLYSRPGGSTCKHTSSAQENSRTATGLHLFIVFQNENPKELWAHLQNECNVNYYSSFKIRTSVTSIKAVFCR